MINIRQFFIIYFDYGHEYAHYLLSSNDTFIDNFNSIMDYGYDY